MFAALVNLLMYIKALVTKERQLGISLKKLLSLVYSIKKNPISLGDRA